MDSQAAAYLGMGLAVGLGAIGTGIGMGNAVSAAIEGTVRQPEAGGSVRTLMFIGLAFMEALALYALVIAFILLGQANQAPENTAAAASHQPPAQVEVVHE